MGSCCRYVQKHNCPCSCTPLHVCWGQQHASVSSPPSVPLSRGAHSPACAPLPGAFPHSLRRQVSLADVQRVQQGAKLTSLAMPHAPAAGGSSSNESQAQRDVAMHVLCCTLQGCSCLHCLFVVLHDTTPTHPPMACDHAASRS